MLRNTTCTVVNNQFDSLHTFQSILYRSKRALSDKDSQQGPTVIHIINPVTTTEFDFDFSDDYVDISTL